MKIKRIVPNIAARDLEAAKRFYCDILGLEIAMDLGWIATFTTDGSVKPQLSVATGGGSDTAVPDVSIEVDDLNEALSRFRKERITIEYGPVTEPWGVRRFYVRDPSGRLLNILEHSQP
jgi:catechol 2,3-dioxygenase-like lactoylglutathione lyase family enzyme